MVGVLQRVAIKWVVVVEIFYTFSAGINKKHRTVSYVVISKR
jgi:hypothetical protein